MLNRAARIIRESQKTDVDIRREINADNSIDWELRIAVKKGADVDDIVTDLAQALKGVPNTWIGIGVRFLPDNRLERDVKKKAEYERFHSALQVHAHYQRNTDRKIQTNVLAMQDILASMRKNKRRKPNTVFVRVHWNARGRRPE